MRVVFVHGTGVRQAVYERTFAVIGAALEARHPGVEMVECCWGDAVDARLNLDGASIPAYAETKSPAAEEGSDDERLWATLYGDPLFELRVLTLRPATPATSLTGDPALGRLDGLVRDLTRSTVVDPTLEQAHAAAAFHRPLARLVGSPAYGDAVRVGRGPVGELREAIARALVAGTVVEMEEQDGTTLTAARRDELVTVVAGELGGVERGFAGDVARKLLARPLTWQLRRRRGRITDAVYPFSGDIVRYQARGREIRRFIAQRLGAGDRAVLLGHSLGGVAAFELLIEDEAARANVERLVTVGSQAPFLYELDALQTLPLNAELPADLPPWVNVYDPNDMLSYVAEGVFPERVSDVEVRSGQPFPQSHSAYWTNPTTWDAFPADR